MFPLLPMVYIASLWHFHNFILPFWLFFPFCYFSLYMYVHPSYCPFTNTSFSLFVYHPSFATVPIFIHFAPQCTTSPHRHWNGESTGARTLWVWSVVKTALILSLVLWKPRDLELVSCDAMCLISLPPINLSASADWMVLNQFLTPNKGWREWAGKGAGVGSFCL